MRAELKVSQKFFGFLLILLKFVFGFGILFCMAGGQVENSGVDFCGEGDSGGVGFDGISSLVGGRGSGLGSNLGEVDSVGDGRRSDLDVAELDRELASIFGDPTSMIPFRRGVSDVRTGRVGIAYVDDGSSGREPAFGISLTGEGIVDGDLSIEDIRAGMSYPVKLVEWTRARLVRLGVSGLVIYNVGKAVGFGVAGWNVAPDDPVSKVSGAAIGAMTSVVMSETVWGLAIVYAIRRYGGDRVLAYVRSVKGLRVLEPLVVKILEGKMV